MKTFVTLGLLICAWTNVWAQTNTIVTIAGTGTGSFSGDGGQATDATLYVPTSVCVGNLGDIYFSDGVNQRVRKIDVTGIVTTIAGNGIAGYNGDNLPATNAKLNAVCDIWPDSNNNIYIADALNNRIRKVTISSGLITTVAGTGAIGSSGDGGLATNAALSGPTGVCLDNTGNIYIADYDNNKVRKVDAATGTISTIAGNGVAGYNGDGIPATNAEIHGAIQVAVDRDGNVLICDQWNHRVRRVNKNTGIITTIAGTGIQGYSGNDSAATTAKLNQPSGLFVDKDNNIYVAEYGNGTIRKIDGATGVISLIAGTGTRGYSGDGGPATSAKLRCADVYLDTFGTTYIADYENNRIRMVYNPKLATPEIAESGYVKVYPSPAGDVITVDYKLEDGVDGDFALTDMAGRTLIAKNLPAYNCSATVNITSLSPGLYTYKVLQKNMLISSGKIIKQ